MSKSIELVDVSVAPSKEDQIATTPDSVGISALSSKESQSVLTSTTSNESTKQSIPSVVPSDFCYEEHSNFFSWITVSFLSKLLHTGGRRPLNVDDLGTSAKNIKPGRLYADFEREWEKELKKPEKKRSLVMAIVRATGIGYWSLAMLLNIFGMILTFAPTIVLQLFTTDLQNDRANSDRYWWYAIVLLLIPICTALVNSAVQMMIVKVAVIMKSMTSEAIYRKALRLSSAAKGTTSTGQLVNLMSTDTNSLMMFTLVLTLLMMIPFMLVICIVMVANLMGRLTWVAVGIYCVMLFFQILVVGFAQPIRAKILKTADARVKLTNEILTGIRIIKYYCWEKPFKGKIYDIRNLELKYHYQMTWMMNIGIDCLMTLVPNIVPLVCFSLYPSFMNKGLDAATAYTSFTLFKILQMPFFMLPMVAFTFVQFKVSINRITNFLDLADVDPTLVERDLPAGSSVPYKDINGAEKVLSDYEAEKDAVIIRDGYFAWGDNDNCLQNVNVRVPKGSLVAVVGRVGSGKTSFVSALVGEMTKNAGAVVVNGSMSLSAQQAWLVNDTVRNNILFGRPYDEKKYKEILRVCCLEDDLKMLAGGDQCEIGDRGINVSGGQKARISLARCCYSDSDIVIMDDPIAAVDSHVGKALFHKCIAKYMTGRTRVLVTNATQYLHKCDYVIVLENNSISHQGTYEELKAANIDFMALLTEEDGSSSMAASRRSMHEKEEAEKRQSKAPEVAQAAEEETGQLTTEETKVVGKMSWSVYAYYARAFGSFLMFLVIFGFFMAAVFYVVSQLKLMEWSGEKACDEYNDACIAKTNGYIWSYFTIIMIYAAFTILRIVTYVPGRMHAARKIHNNLADVIIDAPIAFHDVTPVGRILNRFNKDMMTVDAELPHTMTMFLQQVFMLAAECVAIIIATKGLMTVVLLIAAVIFYFIQKSFRRSNTDIQRIESLTRTPIFSDFQGVLLGSPSIRAYGHQDRFVKGIETKLDVNNNTMLVFQWASAWLVVRSDCIAALMSFLVAVIAIVGSNFMTAAMLGLALSSSSGLSNYMKQMVKMLAQMEAQMNAVERVKEYVDNVQPEPPMITDVRPPEGWPSEGRIEMVNAKLRYRDGPLVMKGVNLSVDPHEKVGVVGRTGAGKSTMMIALFRITDLCEGSISIDGVDLGKLGLEDVRRALCIIPQDPVLFSATVRFNLDPFNESSDEDIWSVLEQVELKDAIDRLPKKLEDNVEEGGSNFSVGERQLICMARALLRKPKILIMDEATASLDNETDNFLQKMIRKQFAHCTTLTIAHRLNTIMDATRVCVMDQGVVAEYDTPYNLLQKEDSIFRGMVVAANDPSLFEMVPGCEELKCLLREEGPQENPAN